MLVEAQHRDGPERRSSDLRSSGGIGVVWASSDGGGCVLAIDGLAAPCPAPPPAGAPVPCGRLLP